jgi:hypothetical protein
MKYAVEMGSDDMIYILVFIQIDSGIQKLIGGKEGDTQTAWRSHTPPFNFSK